MHKEDKINNICHANTVEHMWVILSCTQLY